MMLDLSWVSTIPWVIGVFLLVKMLFSKADGALRIVSGLPVTGILRGLTIKASEMGVVLAAVTVSVLSISVSLLLSTGVDAIGLACLHLLLPALLLYAIWNLHRGSAAYTYLCMICSQLAVYVPIWLAISLLTLPWGGPTPLGCLYSLAGIVAGSIVCTMLGIVFPMTKHNPLTAIVGLGSFALAGTLLLFAIGLLDLRGPILAVVLVAILAAMILYSILGIQTHQRSMRYEHR